jgi:hypothetical protein
MARAPAEEEIDEPTDSELGIKFDLRQSKTGPDEVVRRIDYWDSLECVGVINIAQTACTNSGSPVSDRWTRSHAHEY